MVERVGAGIAGGARGLKTFGMWLRERSRRGEVLRYEESAGCDPGKEDGAEALVAEGNTTVTDEITPLIGSEGRARGSRGNGRGTRR